MKKKSFSAYYKLATQKNEKRIGNQVLTPDHHISALKQEKKKCKIGFSIFKFSFLNVLELLMRDKSVETNKMAIFA